MCTDFRELKNYIQATFISYNLQIWTWTFRFDLGNTSDVCFQSTLSLQCALPALVLRWDLEWHYQGQEIELSVKRRVKRSEGCLLFLVVWLFDVSAHSCSSCVLHLSASSVVSMATTQSYQHSFFCLDFFLLPSISSVLLLRKTRGHGSFESCIMC